MVDAAQPYPLFFFPNLQVIVSDFIPMLSGVTVLDQIIFVFFPTEDASQNFVCTLRPPKAKIRILQ
jgi:hypothetical protein